MRVRKRPRVSIELPRLGCVDPFDLALEEQPPGSGRARLRGPGDASVSVERAGLAVAGCSQALMDLSMRWLLESKGGELPGEDPGAPPLGEMRMVLRRREARLIASLLRRHLARLPEPPEWMRDLQRAVDEMDEFLRWQPE